MTPEEKKFINKTFNDPRNLDTNTSILVKVVQERFPNLKEDEIRREFVMAAIYPNS